MSKQYRCCACEKVFINPDEFQCDCGCILEPDVEYYVERIAELEEEIKRLKKVFSMLAKMMKFCSPKELE
jgi:hypothetical protein